MHMHGLWRAIEHSHKGHGVPLPLQVLDHESNGRHRLLGQFTTSAQKLAEAAGKPDANFKLLQGVCSIAMTVCSNLRAAGIRLAPVMTYAEPLLSNRCSTCAAALDMQTK